MAETYLSQYIEIIRYQGQIILISLQQFVVKLLLAVKNNVVINNNFKTDNFKFSASILTYTVLKLV